MTRSDWQTLEALCRRVLREHLGEDPTLAEHEITDAVRLTGAFAASVADDMARREEKR